jgi:hypothetical protein
MGSIPVRVTKTKDIRTSSGVFCFSYTYRIEPRIFEENEKAGVGELNQTADVAPARVLIPVRVTKRNKSELFRQSKLVRICFFFIYSS